MATAALSGRARRREALTGLAFITPNLIVFGLFMFLPLIGVFIDSTKESAGFGPSEYVGLDNYAEMLRDATFWRSLVNTIGYALVSLPLALGAGLGMALLLNRKMPMRGLLRTIYFVPTVISALAAGTVARWMFNENIGVVNKVLGSLGIGAVDWQSNGAAAAIAVVSVTLWARVGVYMVVFLAALQSIPRESYEASAVDGASAWQQFRHVTLPGLRFSIVFLAVYGLIESFQVFDLVYVMTAGGPGDSTNVLGLYAYQTAFQTRERGLGAAIGVVLLLLLALASLVLVLVNRRSEAKA